MCHLFIDEIREVFEKKWFWSANQKNLSSYQRSDYHKPEIKDLASAVRSTMGKQLGRSIEGPVSIITHLRTFGYCFNPVSFYYCWDQEKTIPHAMMTEITNTPWHERYSKCFDLQDLGKEKSTHNFKKEFHVSPFIGMDVNYDWHFHGPAEKFKVDMVLFEDQKIIFSAHLNLTHKIFNLKNSTWALIRFPLLTFRITFGIYWHALLLRLKGCRFYSHPKNSISPTQ